MKGACDSFAILRAISVFPHPREGEEFSCNQSLANENKYPTIKFYGLSNQKSRIVIKARSSTFLFTTVTPETALKIDRAVIETERQKQINRQEN
jgi:hypothetical protein